MKHTNNYRLNMPERRSSPPDPADIEDLNYNAEIIDEEMHRLEVEKATKEELEAHKKQAVLDHPNNSVTDDKIGNRAIGALSGKLTALFSAVGNAIKGITGTANWNDAPPTTLTSVKTHIDDNTKHITENEYTKWNTVTNKANKADVLQKDNTTAYTPTANYHPATKKYVDDTAGGAGNGDMLKSVYDTNNNGIVDNAEKLGGKTAADFVPVTRTVNGKALSGNISLTATDIGALGASGKAVDSAKLNNKAENALNVNSASLLGGKAEANLSVSYAASAGSAVDQYARDTATNANTNANGRLPNSGGTIWGSLNVTGNLMSGQYARLSFGNWSGLNGAILCADSGTHGIIFAPYNAQNWFYGHIYPHSTQAAFGLGNGTYRWNCVYLTVNPNVSCDSKGKVLIANVDYSGIKPKGRSNTGSIPIAELRTLIKELEIREYYRYKTVIDEDAEPQIITNTNEDGEETTQEMPVYKQVVDTEHKELGIFIDDLKDNKYFDLLGRVHTDESTGETSYSMDTGSYATLALVGAKDALNRLDKLCNMLVSKGIITQEELTNI